MTEERRPGSVSDSWGFVSAISMPSNSSRSRRCSASNAACTESNGEFREASVSLRGFRVIAGTGGDLRDDDEEPCGCEA